MKQIILIIIFISFCISLFSQKKYSPIKLKNIIGDIFEIRDSITQKSIIMYYSEPTCSGCVNYLVNLFNKNNIENFYIIIEDRNDILYRKKLNKEFIKTCNYIKSLYFDEINSDFSFYKHYINGNDSPYVIFYDDKSYIYNSNKIFSSNIHSFDFDNKFIKHFNEFINK